MTNNFEADCEMIKELIGIENATVVKNVLNILLKILFFISIIFINNLIESDFWYN
jgi:hypothetical protein